MILYHGTNQYFEKIDLSKGNPYKDFGQGFYLTPDLSTAKRMAKKRTILYGGKPIVFEYLFDDSCLKVSDLNVIVFPEKASIEWARFVDKNRSHHNKGRNTIEDIVIGPIANDGVAYLLGRFHEGTKTIEELAVDLQDKYLDQQYFFGTEHALSYLKRINIISL